MRALTLTAVIGALLGGSATAAPFGPRDLFALVEASDPQIAPDGSEVAYIRSSADVMTDSFRRTLWIVDAKSGAQTPLAADVDGPRQPRWSPDGARLAFVTSREGRFQIRVAWRASGAAAVIADLPEAPRDIVWSPDGRRIAFIMLTTTPPPTLGAPLPKPEGAKWAEPPTVIESVAYRRDGEGYLKPGFDHLYIVDAEGGAPRQLTFGSFNDSGRPAFTPDGGFLIFSADRSAGWALSVDRSDIYELAIDTGALRVLVHGSGPCRDPTASPDGRSLAYLTYTARRRGYENLELHVADRNGQGDRSLTADLDRSVGRFSWAATSRAIVLQYADHGVGKLAEQRLDGGRRVLAEGLKGAELDRPYTGGEFSLARDGAVAFTLGGPDRPGDVAVARAGGVRRLTDLDAGLFAAKALGAVKPLKVASAYDGLGLDAWVITPPDFDPSKRYPLLLEIHGGPYSSYGPVFASELQLYASAGYVVVYANPRGSTSYGFAFADQINGTYPSHDYDDLMSVVDAAARLPFVDPRNLFVTGGSGGGLLTAWIVGKTDRFRAAASQKPVINWTSEVLTVDGYVEQTTNWFAKPPWEDPAGYWARSPLSLVGHVSTPTLVMVGSEDRRTPPSEAEQFYQALQLRRTPTALVRIPGASHGGLAARPSQEAGEAAAIIAWFERYRVRP